MIEANLAIAPSNPKVIYAMIAAGTSRSAEVAADAAVNRGGGGAAETTAHRLL